MSAPAVGRAAIEQAFSGLWSALRAVDDPDDRKVLLDCARDALDRGARLLAPEAPPAFVAGTFAVEATIRSGAMGSVLKVRHRDLGRLHALKALRTDRAKDPILKRLMLREAEHHLAVRHPAVVAAEAALRLDDGRPALLMAFVDGPSLAERLESGPLPPADVIALGLRLAAGLTAIHAAGLLHLDLKPANILLPHGVASQAQICDFGLSLPIGSAPGGGDLLEAGTRGFTAPEQSDPQAALDERADLYALGAVLRRAAAGNAAAPLAALIDQLRAASPADRPADATAIERALAAIDGADAQALG